MNLAENRSRLAGIPLADHQAARADGCRPGVGVIGHESNSGRGSVGDGDPACARDDVEEGFAGTAIEFEDRTGVNLDGGWIGESSGEQAVGPEPAEFESAAADPGAARPSGTGVVEDKSPATFLAQQARA